MNPPNTKKWRKAWKWLKPEMEDAVIRIAFDYAGWRKPR